MALRIFKYTKSPYYQIRGTIGGHVIHESTGTDDRKKAERLRLKRENELFDRIKLGEVPPLTFAAAADHYSNKGGEIKYVTKLVAYFKDEKLKNIGQAEIEKAAKILYPNAKASTINRSLISPFITVAKTAVDDELPGASMRKIRRRKEAKPMVTPADDEHIAKLLPYCSEGLAALINLMTYTGLRTGEALRVKKEDCKDGYIAIGKTKNGEPRLVPAPQGWTFPAQGFELSTTQGVGRAILRASKAASIEYRDGHELGRHAFAARWLRGGHSIKGLKEAGGWKKLAVVDQSYGHLEQTAVHDTMRELSRRK